jgi:hypothetical protein
MEKTVINYQKFEPPRRKERQVFKNKLFLGELGGLAVNPSSL